VSTNECPNNRSDSHQPARTTSTCESAASRTRQGNVNLTVTIGSNSDADLVRQALPDATERVEVRTTVAPPLDETDVPETVTRELRIFQCTYPSMPEARDACRLLPNRASCRLSAVVDLDEEELEALVEYHARCLLTYQFVIYKARCFGSSDLRWEKYHISRLHALDILGEARVNSIFDRILRTFDPRTQVAVIPAAELHPVLGLDDDSKLIM